MKENISRNKSLSSYLIFSKSHVEQGNPCCHVVSVHSLVICALHDKVERLGEAEEEDDVDDGEGEHVSGDHGKDHRNKWTRELYGSIILGAL